MAKIIRATALQRKLRSVLDEVIEEHTPYIITRGGRPEAVLIPYGTMSGFCGLTKRVRST